MRAIFSPTATDLPASGDAAFAVYRNTWLSACLDALAANYPTVLALLGAEPFKALAVEYARLKPPRSPVLADYGKDFAEFIGEGPLAREYAYLADVARLERLWTESYFAPDAPAPGPEQFARLDAEDLLSRTVHLHPSARLARFATPAVTIWHAHQQPGGFDQLEPEWQAERALVLRNDMRVVVHALDDPVFSFLIDVQQGEKLGDSATRFVERNPGADLESVLAWVLSAGVLSAPADQTKRRS